LCGNDIGGTPMLSARCAGTDITERRTTSTSSGEVTTGTTGRRVARAFPRQLPQPETNWPE
jgi:hypothetical protein